MLVAVMPMAMMLVAMIIVLCVDVLVVSVAIIRPVVIVMAWDTRRLMGVRAFATVLHFAGGLIHRFILRATLYWRSPTHFGRVSRGPIGGLASVHFR